MQCFDHSDTPALGVCSICGRGVCGGCATEVGNRLACTRSDCASQATVMRALTKASRPDLAFGASGLLLVGFGAAAAISLDDWILLFIAALGALFVGLALLARRAGP